MSKMLNNPVLKGASGMLGDTVVFRTIRGQLQMANRPKKRKGVATPKQEAVQRRFQDATLYAKKQLLESDSLALYTAGITDRKHSAYLVAMNDYLVSPVVGGIDAISYRGAVGDSISVRAIDDFAVTAVKVVILDSAGAVIEQGAATADPLHVTLWEYKATVVNAAMAGTTIRAVAYDRPGNTGTLEIVL